jgi:hypothetical protein
LPHNAHRNGSRLFSIEPQQLVSFHGQSRNGAS